MQFLKFFDVSKFFSSSKKSLDNPEKIKLTQQATDFLKNNHLDIYYEMVINGYTPTTQQNELFNTKFKKIMRSKSDVIDVLITKHNYKLSPEEFFHFFENADVSTKSSILEESKYGTKILREYQTTGNSSEKIIYRSVYEHMRSLVEEPEYQTYFLNKFISSLKSTSTVFKDDPQTIFNIIISFDFIRPSTFRQIDISEYMELSKKVESLTLKKQAYMKDERVGSVVLREQALKSVSKSLNKRLSRTYENHISKIVDETKVHYLSEKATKKALEFHKMNIEDKFSIKHLPEVALDKIQNIEDIYTNILKHEDKSSIVEKSTQIVGKSLAQLIDKYISMMPENRLTMFNSEGKNSEQILLESLDNLITVLDNNLKELQQDNLTDLSVQNRVLKAKSIS